MGIQIKHDRQGPCPDGAESRGGEIGERKRKEKQIKLLHMVKRAMNTHHSGVGGEPRLTGTLSARPLPSYICTNPGPSWQVGV